MSTTPLIGSPTKVVRYYPKAKETVTQGFGNTKIKVVNFTYYWTISNFSFCHLETGKEISSPVFTVADNDYKWILKLYPSGNTEQCKDYLSVYLQLMPESNSTTVKAKFKLCILKENGRLVNRTVSQICVFSKEAYGFNKFVKRDFLEDKENGLLNDDQLVIYCEINLGTGTSTSIDSSFGRKMITSQTHLIDNLRWLLESRTLTDVFLVMNNKHKFAAHKAILAARSTTFATMFLEYPEKNEFAVVADISIDLMNMVLQFLYTGEIELDGLMVKDFIEIADAYKFMDSALEAECETVITKLLTPLNAVETLIFSDDHFMEKLQKNTLNFIVDHAKEVIKSDGYTGMAKTHPHLAEKLFGALSSMGSRELNVSFDVSSSPCTANLLE